MNRERLEYFAIEYFIYWNSTLPKFPLKIVNVLPSDVRYADYLSVPDIVIHSFTFESGGFLTYPFC